VTDTQPTPAAQPEVELSEEEWATLDGVVDEIIDAAENDDIDTRTERNSDLAAAVERILATREAAAHEAGRAAGAAEAWYEGAQAATDWIKSGAWLAAMPANPYAGSGDPR